jgi:hypothetical protein
MKNARLLRDEEMGAKEDTMHTGRTNPLHATVPSPEGLQVARTERSPGFGRVVRLPGNIPVAK